MRVLVCLVVLAIASVSLADTHTTAITITKTKSLADIARETRQKRTGKARIYTDKDLTTASPLAEINPSTNARIGEVPSITRPSLARVTEKDAARLKAECRAAGGDAAYNKPVQTDTYVVNGKIVKVTGPHANLAELQRAKEICREAMAAEAQLKETR